MEHTNKITILHFLDISLSHSLLPHPPLRLRQQPPRRRRLGIITISNSLKEAFHAQQSHHPLAMRNMRIRQQPQFHLLWIEGGEEGLELGIWGEEFLEGNGVVYFAVEV